MKFLYPILLLAFCLNTAWADFSNSTVSSHPLLPHNGPFVMDISGEWPSDCHPGEQKPVIHDYDGDSVLIEFEIIVEHVTCNEVPTPYRVLVDMSDVIGTVEPQGNGTDIDVTVRFDGAELETAILLSCALISPCPYSPSSMPDIYPESGLYHAQGLEKQGLLLARQNSRMAAYPLIYDESGSSEWLFGGDGIIQDAYFADLYELTGGQCLGCLPPDDPPDLTVVGKFTLLMDSQGLVQMKINDGLFTTYEQSEFGYGQFEILDADDGTPVKVQDLSGRWAFSEDNSDALGADEVTAPPTSVLPLVFDVTLRSNVTNPPPPTIGTPSPVTGIPAGVFYSILNMDREQVAQMLCEHRGEMICDLKTPNIENGDYDEWYKVQLLSIERMIMTNTAEPDEGVTTGTGTAVRID
jgi:hypothetical protein